MLKRALVYGGAVAVAGAVWVLIEHALGFFGENLETGRVAGYLAYLFPIVGVALAIRAAKRDETGEFTFGDGFKQGALVVLVAAVLGAIFFYVYVTAINPDFSDTMRAATTAELRKRGYEGRELQQAQAMQGGMTTPGALAAINGIGSLIWGLIVAAALALFMRRKEQRPAGDGYGG